jgi:hypothetical protein
MTDDDPGDQTSSTELRQQFERLLIRLIDRVGTGSGSWSR